MIPSVPTAGTWLVGRSPKIAVDRLQLSSEGILKRGTNPQRLVPVGTVRSIDEVVFVVFEVIIRTGYEVIDRVVQKTLVVEEKTRA